MKGRLPGWLLGPLMFALLVVNTLFWAVPVYISIFIKLLTPKGRWRDRASKTTTYFAQRWAMMNVWFSDQLTDIHWDIRIPMELSPDKQYIVSSNHQSWNDIFVLIKAFGTRAPFFKFFLKKQLIWVPVLGPVWWGLDYPFMQRHTREQIARNPELKGRDLETTRRACEKYAHLPVAILIFLEGTRFTPEKQRQQKSPYQYLLKPKSGGLAFALGAMGDRLSHLLDVTIAYPDGSQSMWGFLAGRVRRVVVDVRSLRIPPDFFTGNYEDDPVFRKRVQGWVADLWEEKDRRMAELMAQAAES